MTAIAGLLKIDRRHRLTELYINPIPRDGKIG